MQTLITQAEYARMRGFSRPYVSKLISKGKIKAHGERKLIDPVEAGRDLASAIERIDHLRAALEDEPELPAIEPETDEPVARMASLTELKARTEDERHQLLRIERLEKEGKLLPRELVAEEQETAARMVRRTFDGLVSRAEDLYAAGREGGVKALRARLKALVREMQDALAEDLTHAADEVEAARAEDEAEDVAA